MNDNTSNKNSKIVIGYTHLKCGCGSLMRIKETPSMCKDCCETIAKRCRVTNENGEFCCNRMCETKDHQIWGLCQDHLCQLLNLHYLEESYDHNSM